MVDSSSNKPPRNLRECIEDLQQTYRILPKVDKDGSSECPFAEDIYAKKQRHELEVESHLDKLKREKKEVIKKIRNIKNASIIIASNKESIHNLSAYEKYEEAEKKQQEKIKLLKTEIERLQLQINDLEILLGITGQKKWPKGHHESGADLNNSVPPTAGKTRRHTPNARTNLPGSQRGVNKLFMADSNRSLNTSASGKLK